MTAWLVIVTALLVVCTLGVIAWGVFAPRAWLFGPIRSRLHADATGAREVALTFDDGPLPGSTDRVLEALAEHGCKATFFVIGRHVEAHPELTRRIVGEGHTIANHTMDHHRNGLLNNQPYWNEQIARAQDAIERVTGARPTLFRAPMGFKAPPLMRAARRHGLEVVAWNRRSYDAGLGSRETILNAARSMRPGDILLLHDGRDPESQQGHTRTAETIGEVLSILKERGLRPVRLESPS